MNIVIAIDSFKGSMTSMEAGESAAEGIRRVYPGAQIRIRPLADGGEGTVEALTAGLDGKLVTIPVTGPAGLLVDCPYGIVEETKTAIIEMSGAAGITQVTEAQRNPLHTTTYGVGEVIKDAIHKGCRHFIVGIGGSATNDGGLGMLQALGFDMLDASGQPVSMFGKGLADLTQISAEHVLPELAECTFRIACDVTNPLCGEHGCSAVFGPQKGATPDIVQQMDGWLSAYAALAKNSFPKANPNHAGAGAAGGLGFAFLTFFNATLESGVKIVLEETRLSDYVKDADIVLTGEGRLDGQTVMGKAPIGVAQTAKEHGCTVLGFSGSVAKDASACNEKGIDAFFPILRGVSTLEEAMDTEKARQNMADAVEQVFRTIHAIRG